MEKTKDLQIQKDLPNKKLTIARYFDAAPEKVWRAWTESEFLDQWWAPKPWKAETKEMDFKVGGSWLYSMVGPKGERHNSRVDYTAIDDTKSFSATDAFCDENWNKSDAMPSMNWQNSFDKDGSGTTVNIKITFTRESDMKQILEMGFEEGFGMGLAQLDYLLSEKFVKI